MLFTFLHVYLHTQAFEQLAFSWIPRRNSRKPYEIVAVVFIHCAMYTGL